MILIIGFLLLGLERFGLLGSVDGLVDRLLSPVQLSLFSASRSISHGFSTVLEIGSLRGKNATLEEKAAFLEAENANLKKLEAENKLLRDQLDLEPKPQFPIKSAQVLGFNPSLTRSFINIDKGEDDQIQTGDVVILKDILLGLVSSTQKAVASVRLLSDPASKVLAQTQSGAKGVVVGEFGSQMKITKVLLEETLTSGDLVTTTGDENFPQGLVVGKISQVRRKEAELFQEAQIEPMIDTNHLALIFVRKK